MLPDLILGRYRVDSELGGGGIGVVYKMYDTRLKRYVAVKTLKRGVLVDPEEVRQLKSRFANEAEAGARINNHPNVVGVFDFATDASGIQYLIQEFIPGGTLKGRIRSGGEIPPNQTLRLTADIARGLQAAHLVDLVHRDIKPDNIFLGADGRALVGDFGIAQIDDRSQRTHTAHSHPGTPLYMSPEQSNSGYVTPATDQFSLGLVVFEMLTGKAYKSLGKRGASALLEQMPPPLRALVTRMTADDPDDRYPSMDAVLAAVERVATTLTTSEIMFVPDLAGTTPTVAATPLRDTPLVNLQPVQPVQPVLDRPTQFAQLAPLAPVASSPPGSTPPLYPGPPTSPRPRRSNRRAFLLGLGGIVFAGAIGGGVVTGMSHNGAVTPTPIGSSTIGGTVVSAGVAGGRPLSATAAAPTSTSVPAVTDTAVPTPANTAMPAVLAMPTVANTPVPMPTNTPAPVPTNVPAPVPMNTNTPVPAPTNTPVPAPTITAVPPPPPPPAPLPTNTPMPAPTNTPVPAPTNTPIPPTATPRPPTATPQPPTATPAPPPPTLAVFSAGTTGQQRDTVAAGDVVPAFSEGNDVFGFVNYGGAAPDTDALEVTIEQNGTPGAPLPLTLTTPDGFVVFPLGPLPTGQYRLVVRFRGNVVREWQFAVNPPPTAVPVRAAPTPAPYVAPAPPVYVPPAAPVSVPPTRAPAPVYVPPAAPVYVPPAAPVYVPPTAAPVYVPPTKAPAPVYVPPTAPPAAPPRIATVAGSPKYAP